MTGGFGVNDPLTPPAVVNGSLTQTGRMSEAWQRWRDRPRREVETADYGAFARRIVAAYGRRVADRDIEALAGLAELAELVDSYTLLAVANLRSEAGGRYSWADIGRVLGMTRQGAQQRYGARIGEAAK